MPRCATLRRIASMILLRLLAGQRPRTAASRRARWHPPARRAADDQLCLRAQLPCSSVSGSAARLSCPRQPAGAGVSGAVVGAVVELLLGSEQQVEQLRAQALAERDGQHRADGERAAASVRGRPRRRARLRGLAQRAASPGAGRWPRRSAHAGACGPRTAPALAGLPLLMRPYALRAATYAESRLERSSSSSIRRCRYRFCCAARARVAGLAESVLRCHRATASAESLQVPRPNIPAWPREGIAR